MMSRTALFLLLGGSFLCAGQGCAHFVEARAISQFAQALEKQDVAALKLSASAEFEQKALRHAEALDDLKLIRLPDGEASVLKVEDVSDDEKKVTVETGERKQKLQYKLVREKQTGKWVVGDIYTRQKQKGLEVVRTVTEQMDLFLTVREFLSAWDEGSREQALAVTTPELGDLLKELPPIYLARLTRRVVGDKPAVRSFRPKAELDANVAVVVLPRSVGKMVLSLKLLEGQWKVSDVAVEGTGDKDHIPSVQKLTVVLRASTRFLDAYAAADRGALAKICTRKLFREVLAHADLASVPLPRSDAAQTDYEVKMQDRRADFIVRGGEDWIKIALVRGEDDGEPDAPTEYRVEEVTLYEVDGRQEKRLSAMFTARAMVQVFWEALVKRDLRFLKMASTADLTGRIWEKIDEADLRELPLRELEAGPPRIVSTVFRGPVTEIRAIQGENTVTYVVHDRAGEVRIDDVHLPHTGRPASLKTVLESMIPVRHFATGILTGDIALLQRTSSHDYNRLVWKQAEHVPPIGRSASGHLDAPLTAVDRDGDNVLVTLGDERFGAKVLLVREHSQHVVDEILLIAGPQPEQRAKLKHRMRLQLAAGVTQSPATEPARVVVPAVNAASSRSPAVSVPALSQATAAPSDSPAARSAGELTPAPLEPSPEAFIPPGE